MQTRQTDATERRDRREMHTREADASRESRQGGWRGNRSQPLAVLITERPPADKAPPSGRSGFDVAGRPEPARLIRPGWARVARDGLV